MLICALCEKPIGPQDAVYGYDPMESLGGAVWFHRECAEEQGVEVVDAPQHEDTMGVSPEALEARTRFDDPFDDPYDD